MAKTEANNGDECLAFAAREPFDVMMPEMDDDELTRRLKADPATRDVLILTSALRGPDAVEAEQAGADDRGMKSVDAARLNEKRAAGLTRPRRRFTAPIRSLRRLD